MVDSSILQNMVDYASLNQNDVVLDIGAGLGFLTRFLANKCKGVLAVESDVHLVRILREQLKDLPSVKIIEGDVLKAYIPQFNKVVSIPPYNISSRLLLWLFSKNFVCAVLVFQKEFANRLAASIGSEDYGWLTVLTYYHVEVELLDDVPKRMFYPQPEVESIIVRLKPRKVSPFKLKNEIVFRQLVQSLFTERNRKVRNAILPFMKGVPAIAAEKTVKLTEAFPFGDKRVRELAPEDFGALANALSD
jgi:16S rRNA (adenine1518-N6/adenine1519-N6)-dimethyltransferase